MTPPALRRAAARLGSALGTAAHAVGLGPLALRAGYAVLRRLEPGHPLLTRAAAAERIRTRPDPPRLVQAGPATTEHPGEGEPHACRCDSWLLPPHLRCQVHGCRCTDGPDEPSHLPPGRSA